MPCPLSLTLSSAPFFVCNNCNHSHMQPPPLCLHLKGEVPLKSAVKRPLNPALARTETRKNHPKHRRPQDFVAHKALRRRAWQGLMRVRVHVPPQPEPGNTTPSHVHRPRPLSHRQALPGAKRALLVRSRAGSRMIRRYHQHHHPRGWARACFPTSSCAPPLCNLNP